MAPKLGANRVIRDEDRTGPLTAVALSRLAVEALAGNGEVDLDRAGARLVGAIRFYLAERGSGSKQAAWPYPDFLRGSAVQEDVTVGLEVDGALWGSFEAEAAAQGVSAQQLAEHAAFYLAAEIDAGRVTQRILDDLTAAESEQAEAS